MECQKLHPLPWEGLGGYQSQYEEILITRSPRAARHHSGKPMQIDLGKISGQKKNVWWMNPTNGKLSFVGKMDSKVTEFTLDGAYLRGSDRILIATDASKNYLQKDQTELEEKD